MDLTTQVEKLAFQPGEVLVVRVPDNMPLEQLGALQNAILGCIRCLPLDKAPKGCVFVPESVTLDKLQEATLSPEVRKVLGLDMQKEERTNV